MTDTPAPTGSNDAAIVRQRRRIRIGSIALGVVLAVIAGSILKVETHSSVPDVPQSFSTPFDHAIPLDIESLPFTDEEGRTTDLAAFRGRIVVLTDFFTSNQDASPMIAGAFDAVERSLRSDGLASMVAFVEVTVDPRRDSPARLAAYGRSTGVDWTLLTGSSRTIAQFWKYFGVEYTVVPDKPRNAPAGNRETGARDAYNITISNVVYLIDPNGHGRLLTEGLPALGGSLDPKLATLLNPLGRQHLVHPIVGAWTESDLRAAIGWLLGRSVRADGHS